ncbi:MAG: hypothetical protein FJZ86_00945 [Chloroflexi bacterium]|nr:hypothetical protein [Chloroflexota bacterium]
MRGTTTQSGWKVSAFLVEQVYAKGLKITKEVMESLNLERHGTCPNWNYTIRSRFSSA